MILVETHIVKQSNKYYSEADKLCFLSKNLYNASNYVVRQQYFNDKTYLDYNKASFLDNDIIPTYKKNSKTRYVFSGMRIKRGLYVSKDKTKLNADVNGSLNILRKYLISKVAWNNQLWFDCVEQCSNGTILKINVV